MKNLSKEWKNRLDILDIAFQPILNINSGKIYAVEALLRNYKDAGFESIFDVFDTAYNENILYIFDLALREKTFKKFREIANYEDLKLFYNLDNRLFEMPDYTVGNTNLLLKKHNISKENICFELSEREEISDIGNLEKILQHYKNEKFQIAIDDFGTGYSGYKLLFDSQPDIIKIDRYFLQHIEKDMKRKLMVKSITQLAVGLGITVLAEGVETKEEYLVCKDIGCSLVQGYFVQRPTKKSDEIKVKYEHISTLLASCKREKDSSKVEKYIENIIPLQKNSPMNKVVDYFKTNRDFPYVPIINRKDEPVGILAESKIKEYLYSPYGISLLLRESTDEESRLKNLMFLCPSIDINSDISMIIELFSNNNNSHGILITKHSKYYGFLSSSSIIKAMNEENLILARDQNPLTKMPGNRVVESYISEAMESSAPVLLCYFDLDNFKAFNDAYGFRNGDRIIQLFADMLTKKLVSSFFKGHIGGDDFFVSQKMQEESEVSIEAIQNIITLFEAYAKEFYSQKDKKRGYILAKDRDGVEKKFPFLTVSAAIVLVNIKGKSKHLQAVNETLAVQKKVAKKEKKHMSISSLL